MVSFLTYEEDNYDLSYSVELTKTANHLDHKDRAGAVEWPGLTASHRPLYIFCPLQALRLYQDQVYPVQDQRPVVL